MGWQFSTSDFTIPHPAPVNQAFRISYRVTNTGPADEPAHYDHVQVWASNGTKHIDAHEHTPDCTAGGSYGVFVDVPPLSPGYYDVAVQLPDGSGAGATIVVQ